MSYGHQSLRKIRMKGVVQKTRMSQRTPNLMLEKAGWTMKIIETLRFVPSVYEEPSFLTND